MFGAVGRDSMVKYAMVAIEVNAIMPKIFLSGIVRFVFSDTFAMAFTLIPKRLGAVTQCHSSLDRGPECTSSAFASAGSESSGAA